MQNINKGLFFINLLNEVMSLYVEDFEANKKPLS